MLNKFGHCYVRINKLLIIIIIIEMLSFCYSDSELIAKAIRPEKLDIPNASSKNNHVDPREVSVVSIADHVQNMKESSLGRCILERTSCFLPVLFFCFILI